MKIIISPTKKMVSFSKEYSGMSSPIFLEMADVLKNYMQSKSVEELQQLYGCNDKIALQNYDRFQCMDSVCGTTPAIFAYQGLQFQSMEPELFGAKELLYINEHVGILSGLYGYLRPLDGITPYRLEMATKLTHDFTMSLYQYWSEAVCSVLKDEDVIINLASKEYSKVVESNLTKNTQLITCIFYSEVNGILKVKSTEAKMARGAMVQYLAKNQVVDVEKVKNFTGNGFTYDQQLSDNNTFVFRK